MMNQAGVFLQTWKAAFLKSDKKYQFRHNGVNCL